MLKCCCRVCGEGALSRTALDIYLKRDGHGVIPFPRQVVGAQSPGSTRMMDLVERDEDEDRKRINGLHKVEWETLLEP